MLSYVHEILVSAQAFLLHPVSISNKNFLLLLQKKFPRSVRKKSHCRENKFTFSFSNSYQYIQMRVDDTEHLGSFVVGCPPGFRLKRKDAKSSKFWGSELEKKKGLFRMFSQNSEKLIFKRKWYTKRSEKKRQTGQNR
jgi:hypothetical protein